MISIRCATEHTLKLHELNPLQGALKTRTKRNLKELKSSLLVEGLIAPFFVWKGTLQIEAGEKNWILDGHGRHAALRELAEEDQKILWDQDFPVVYIEAPDVFEAKKALLQITSQYGSISKEGAKVFCEDIKGYKAPSIKCVYRKPYTKKVAAPKASFGKAKDVSDIKDNEVVITIAVAKEQEAAVRDLFTGLSYARVL